jgi:hypothetical protein
MSFPPPVVAPSCAGLVPAPQLRPAQMMLGRVRWPAQDRLEYARSITVSLVKTRAVAAAPTGAGRGPGVYRSGLATYCLVRRCRQLIDPSRLMCRQHWYLVPKGLRDLVWASWRSGAGAFLRDHQDAVRLAIRLAGLRLRLPTRLARAGAREWVPLCHFLVRMSRNSAPC